MGDSDRNLLKAVKHYQECLDKYIESRSESKILHCLDKLSRLPVKVSHLEQTGVGRTVNGLRKFGGQVGESAKSLVMKWKDMVVGEQEAEEEEEDDDEEDEDDQEDGYESGDPETSVEEKEEETPKQPKEVDSSSSSHRQSDNTRIDEDRHRKSKKSKHESSSRRESDHQNGHSSRHKSHKRKSDDDSDDEKHHKRRRYDSSDEESEEIEVKPSKHRNDNDDSKSKEKKHRNRDVEQPKEKRHKSSKKSYESSSDADESHKSHSKSSGKHNKASGSSCDKKDTKHKEKNEGNSSSSREKSSSKKHESSSKKTKDCEEPRREKEKDRKSSKKDKESSRSKEHKDGDRKSSSSSSKSSSSKSSKTVAVASGSGTSFAEALGMCEPSSSKNKKKERTSIVQPVEKEKKDKSNKINDLVPKPLKEPITDPFDLNISSLLPTITPNYRPLGNSLLSDSQPKKILSDYEQLSNIITSKTQRTKVYSGNKMGNGKVPTLFELCIRVLQDNIDALEYTGGVPYLVLKPILEKSTPNQLFLMEHHNPYLIEDTDELWQLHCQKAFRNKKREELETWREMYMRCSDEREAKLKALTANIKQSQDKSLPVRTTKLAYVDDVAKPPRNIARKQAKNGTAFVKKPSLTPSARLQSLATCGDAGKVAVPNPGARAAERSSSQNVKPKKAPLMVKSLSLLKNRFRR